MQPVGVAKMTQIYVNPEPGENIIFLDLFSEDVLSLLFCQALSSKEY